MYQSSCKIRFFYLDLFKYQDLAKNSTDTGVKRTTDQLQQPTNQTDYLDLLIRSIRKFAKATKLTEPKYYSISLLSAVISFRFWKAKRL